MGAFDSTLRRIALYRASLELAATDGTIQPAARAAADECFAALCGVLESARIELEGAGVPAGADALVEDLLDGCGELAQCLFRHVGREPDAATVARYVAGLRAGAAALFEDLWLWLQRAA